MYSGVRSFKERTPSQNLIQFNLHIKGEGVTFPFFIACIKFGVH